MSICSKISTHLLKTVLSASLESTVGVYCFIWNCPNPWHKLTNNNNNNKSTSGGGDISDRRMNLNLIERISTSNYQISVLFYSILNGRGVVNGRSSQLTLFDHGQWVASKCLRHFTYCHCRLGIQFLHKR